MNQKILSITLSVILLAGLATLPFMQSANAVVVGYTWAKTYGSPGDEDIFRGIVNACDGNGYIMTGHTDGFGKNLEMYVTKISETGEVVWSKVLGTAKNEQSRSIEATCETDGGYIIAGQSSEKNGRPDMYIVKIDGNGNILWDFLFGNTTPDIAHAITQTNDGKYFVAGLTIKSNDRNWFITKFDSSGTIECQKTWQTNGGKDDAIRAIEQLRDGSILMAGFSHDLGPGGDIFIVKLDSENCEPIWQKTYGGNKFEEVCCILEDDEGIIILEQSFSFSGNSAGWLFKLDQDGNILWQHLLNGKSFDEISAASFVSDGIIAAGEIKATGTTPEDYWLVKFDFDGNVVWQKRIGSAGIEEAEAMLVTKNENFVLAGFSTTLGVGKQDTFIVSVNNDGNFMNECGPEITAQSEETSAIQSDTNANVNNITLQPIDTKFTKLESTSVTRDNVFSIETQCEVAEITKNTKPNAIDDTLTTIMNTTATTGNLTENDLDVDGDVITIVSMDSISINNGTIVNNNDGTATYTPALNYTGTDSFTYTISDGLSKDIGVVIITVEQPPPPPPEEPPVGNSTSTE